jgi:hypothetical protein
MLWILFNSLDFEVLVPHGCVMWMLKRDRLPFRRVSYLSYQLLVVYLG